MDPLEPGPPQLNRFQYWRMLPVIGGTNMMAAMVYSIPSPFYPKETELKGLSASEYGLVLGLYQLIPFISAPIFGSYMYRNDPQIVYALGATLQGNTGALFGLLDWVNGHVKLRALSFFLRILEVIGTAMLFTSACTIVTKRANDAVAATFSMLELVFGVGFSIGPIIGEALYVVGGFRLPFFVLGGLIFTVGLLLPVYFRLEGMNDQLDPAAVEAKGSFKNSGATPRQFHLEPLTIGAAYFLPGVTLALLLPPFGFICDRLDEPASMTLHGMTLSFVSIGMVGSAPFLPVALGSGLAFVLVLAGLFLFGVGMPMIYISTFLQVLNDAKLHLLLDSNGLSSGWRTGGLNLGSFAKPAQALSES